MDSSEGSADSPPAHGLSVESVDGLTPDSLQLAAGSTEVTGQAAYDLVYCALECPSALTYNQRKWGSAPCGALGTRQ